MRLSVSYFRKLLIYLKKLSTKTFSNFKIPLMKRVRVLKLDFDANVLPQDIPKLRGAIIEKTERAKILFHNHLDDNKFRYAYPLIQYKSIKGKASIICIDEGTEEIHALFRTKDMNLKIGDKNQNLLMSGLNAKFFNIQTQDRLLEYNSYKWLGLNSENFEKYIELKDIDEQKRFLEKIMIGNILALAEGIGYKVKNDIKVYITMIESVKMVRYKNAKMLSFNLRFKTNFFIPNYLGLGKGASIGFGNVMQIRREEQ